MRLRAEVSENDAQWFPGAPGFRWPSAACGFLLASASSLLRAAESLTNEEFKLRPPREEIPLTFWEQNATWIWLGSVLALVLLGLLVWFIFRPRRVVPLPPAERARSELEALVGKPATRQTWTEVSQIVKRYFCESFDLPREELTTSEFSKVLFSLPETRPKLAAAATDFLRKGDELKFSPEPREGNPVPEALSLVSAAEIRRDELRREEKAEASRAAAERKNDVA